MMMIKDGADISQEAFKAITDKFTPRIWTEACVENLDEPAFPRVPEPAGF